MKASELLTTPKSINRLFNIDTIQRAKYWQWLRRVFPEHTRVEEREFSTPMQRFISAEAAAFFPHAEHVVNLYNQTENEQTNTKSDQHDHHSSLLLFTRRHGLTVA
jgi:hypothetical protein